MRWILLLLLTTVSTTAGCRVSASVEPPGSKKTPENTWIRTDLYFGLSKRGGAIIPDEEWNKFVDEQVTPRFPDGFTVTSAQGHYLQDGQVIVEPSKVLTIMHRGAAHDADDRINAIVKEYCQRFEQDSVLRSDEPNDVRFLTKQSAQN
jgi:hypothetical protein